MLQIGGLGQIPSLTTFREMSAGVYPKAIPAGICKYGCGRRRCVMLGTYNSALDLVRTSGDFSTYFLLKNLSPEEIKKELEIIFSFTISTLNDYASQKYWDERALNYFSWLMKATEDLKFLPILVDDKDCKGKKSVPYTKEAEEARIRADVTMAKKAMELYPSLPREVGEKRAYKTKEAVLAKIATGWKAAKTEEEAEAFFKFIIDTQPLTGELQKMTSEIFRNVTDASFPAKRIAKAIRHLSDRSGWPEELKTILAIGWARNTKRSGVCSIISTFSELINSSEAAFEFLGQSVTQINCLEEKVGKLLKIMEADYKLPSLRNLHIHYLSLDSVAISYNITLRGGEEKHLHSTFERLRDNILTWKKENPDIKTHLEVVATGYYRSDHIIGSRSDDF